MRGLASLLAGALCCGLTTAHCQATLVITMPSSDSVEIGEPAFINVDIRSDSNDPLSEFLVEFRITRVDGAGLLRFVDVAYGDPQETFQQSRYVFAGNSLWDTLGQTVGSASQSLYPADTFIANDMARIPPVSVDVAPSLLVRLGLDATLATPGDLFAVTVVNASLDGTPLLAVPSPATTVSVIAPTTSAVPEPSSALLTAFSILIVVMRRQTRCCAVRRKSLPFGPSPSRAAARH